MQTNYTFSISSGVVAQVLDIVTDLMSKYICVALPANNPLTNACSHKHPYPPPPNVASAVSTQASHSCGSLPLWDLHHTQSDSTCWWPASQRVWQDAIWSDMDILHAALRSRLGCYGRIRTSTPRGVYFSSAPKNDFRVRRRRRLAKDQGDGCAGNEQEGDTDVANTRIGTDPGVDINGEVARKHRPCHTEAYGKQTMRPSSRNRTRRPERLGRECNHPPYARVPRLPPKRK